MLGCLGASTAWSIWSLIAFRAVAGAGAALFPLSFAIIRDEFPPDRVKVGIGLLSAVFGVGSGFGIVLSGIVVDNLGWRYLFLFGFAPVTLAILLIRRYVPESPVRTEAPLDIPGAVLLSAALVTLLLGLTEGESWGWTSGRLIGALGLAAVLFASWGIVERRSRAPMVDLRMLSQQTVLRTNITTLIAGFALFGCFVLVPRFVETSSADGYGFGASATIGGLYLLPSSIALLFAGPDRRPGRAALGVEGPAGGRNAADQRVRDPARVRPRPALAHHGGDRRARCRRRRRACDRTRARGGERTSDRDRRRDRDQHGRPDGRRRDRRPDRRGAADRADDREHHGAGRERVHGRVRASAPSQHWSRSSSRCRSSAGPQAVLAPAEVLD